MVTSPEIIEKVVAEKPSSMQQRLINKIKQIKPFGESIKKVAQCAPKITDFSSVPSTESWSQLKISFRKGKEVML